MPAWLETLGAVLALAGLWLVGVAVKLLHFQTA